MKTQTNKLGFVAAMPYAEVISGYTAFYLDCSFMQEKQKIKVDVKKTEENLAYFEALKRRKNTTVKEAMPKIPIKVKRG